MGFILFRWVKSKQLYNLSSDPVVYIITNNPTKHMTSLLDSTKEPMVPSVLITGLTSLPAKSLEDFFHLNWLRNKACEDFNNLWKSNDLDVILTLPAPHTAVPFDQWTSITYTALYNLLDYPACIIPTGTVSALDVKDDFVQYSERDRKVYKLCKFSSKLNFLLKLDKAHLTF